MKALHKTDEDIDSFFKNMKDGYSYEALDRISCQLHNLEVLYTGSRGGFHKGLTPKARKLVKKAFKALAEAYQKQGEESE